MKWIVAVEQVVSYKYSIFSSNDCFLQPTTWILWKVFIKRHYIRKWNGKGEHQSYATQYLAILMKQEP